MKILLDHNLDRRLKADIVGHDCGTTFENGWAELTNGELLSAAERDGYDVLLTADTNISKQQNLTGRQLSILVLRALDNRRSTHIEMIEDLLATLPELGNGEIKEIVHYAIKRKD